MNSRFFDKEAVMMIPFVCPIEAVVYEAELDTPGKECMCSKRVSMRGKYAVWTHKVGTDNYNWFLACDIDCYTANVTEGHDQ